MWSTHTETLNVGRGVKISIDRNGREVSFAEAVQLWQDDPDFRTFFSATLAEAPFFAFRWETPPIAMQSATQPFEFVLLDSPELDLPADPDAFKQHFDDHARRNTVVSFPNLGKDAVLVVPYPVGPSSSYSHLGAFVREAPEIQKNALWSLVGRVVKEHLAETPVWLSTAGAGVSWLHVRLDQRPKYYRHSPYRMFPTEP
jgi:hypothetical protein